MAGAWRRFCCSLASPSHSPRGRREAGGKGPSSRRASRWPCWCCGARRGVLPPRPAAWAPSRWPYVWRQGLANLQRPSNQTTTVVLAIGFGAFLLGTLLLVQANLLRTLEDHRRSGATQSRDVRHSARPASPRSSEMLSAAGFKATAPVPIVPMRIQSVKGRPSRRCSPTHSRGRRRRVAQRLVVPPRVSLDLSRHAGLIRADRRGQMVDRPAAPGEISVEDGVARELGVGVGDSIVWDVQGVLDSDARHQPAGGRMGPLRAQLLRGLRARSAREGAAITRDPHADRERGGSGRVPAAVGRAVSQRHHARSLLAAADPRRVDLARGARDTVHGALHHGNGRARARGRARHQPVPAHPRGSLLRTLGATRGQVFRIVFAEYLSLGLMASAAALLLALSLPGRSPGSSSTATSRLPARRWLVSALVVAGLTVAVGLSTVATFSGGRRSRCCERSSPTAAAHGYIPGHQSEGSLHARDRPLRKARTRRRRLG